MSTPQVVSKQRVADHGEVYTHPREVHAMLDLVKHEAERIDSRFLEPACGTGNFLVDILARKLAVVKATHAESQLTYERHAIIAIGSIYGIELLADNVAICRQRLFALFDQQYTQLYETTCKQTCRDNIHFILQRNILHGDALTLTMAQAPWQSLVFSEWSITSKNLIKRRDFRCMHLTNHTSSQASSSSPDSKEKEAHMFELVQEYAPTQCLIPADYQSRLLLAEEV